jgi:hypothetical protein
LDSSSGVMKPKPLSLLNHLTVPVAIVASCGDVCAATEEIAMSNGYERWHCGAGLWRPA